MQYRLSTLFLIIFHVAASLAFLGYCDDADLAVFLGFIIIFLDIIILLAALCINRAKSLPVGIIYALFFLFFGIICSGMLLPLYSKAGEAAYRAVCVNNMKQICLALHNYHDMNKQFPMANTCDKNGKPLYSWRVEILPMLEYVSLHDRWKKDEPWNSKNNTWLLTRDSIPPEYKCPSDSAGANNPFTNYVAIIGPGTAWHEDGPVKLSDLPDGGAHTVMCVEVVNSSVHWAEPRDLTVDETLEGLKTGKGLHISTAHPDYINVLFADGHVESLPAKMPLSSWEKLLTGKLQNLAELDYFNPDTPDTVDVSVVPPDPKHEPWTIILAVAIWLFSVVMLFRRAVKSRANRRLPK